MDVSKTAIRLREVMAEEIAFAKELRTVLQQEHEALPRRDMDTLTISMPKKAELVERLDRLEQRRKELLRSHPGSAIAGLEQFDPKNQFGLEKMWQSLLALITHCQELNRVNASLLDSTQRAVEQALAILHGRSSERALYGPQGRKVGETGQRSLAKA